MANIKTLPVIENRKTVAKSKLFAIEKLDLTFSNGEQREYERMQGTGNGAVMIVPMLDDETMLLIREYCAGTHSYELGFPKGLVDLGESIEIAANRELKEEIGYGSKQLTFIQKVAMAPAFFSGNMSIFLGQGLYPEKLEGDEPEPLDVIPWKLTDYKKLLNHADFNESRSVAALLLIQDYLRENHDE